MGYSNISTTKKHYNSIQKFDSVQLAARKFNELYPPKNKKYKVGKNVSFVPDDYITENDAVETIKVENLEEEQMKKMIKLMKEKTPELYLMIKQVTNDQ